MKIATVTSLTSFRLRPVFGLFHVFALEPKVIVVAIHRETANCKMPKDLKNHVDISVLILSLLVLQPVKPPHHQRPHQPILPRLERDENRRNFLPHPSPESMFKQPITSLNKLKLVFFKTSCTL